MSKVEWIKLTTDMFSHEKIKYLRTLPEGNNLVLIWVMLLTMAGRCNASGMIFLTENIPYTPKMLADELRFEESTVVLALKMFEDLGMVFTNVAGYFTIAGWEEYQNIEGLDKIREQTRKRVEKYRQNQKAIECNVTSNATVTQGNAIDIDKELDIDIEKDINNTLVSSNVDTEQNLIDDFNIIYDHYPKKGTKASAFESYKKWVQKSGRKVGGKTYHLTNKQIWAAVDNYVREQQSKNTELSYYKNFVTLMNQLLDWVVEDGEETN